ncbi:MAG: 2-amino-4-hydroxy-6-hydroxymethyldihydropteridine diphosphokinase [Planctomycetes bacterium]|nr:2-amino-4-hydroxy-6-hydroxymethyldihydropteridine diphosphokinase [Planctomycetota bacterium]
MFDPPHRAYLSLGSNIDPERNLPAAASLLARYGRVLAVSSVWQSAPAGFAEQPDFLNAAVLLETDLSPEEIVDSTIPAIESALGRVREPDNKNASRTIDVDLSLYDRLVENRGGRELPDPDVLTRPFVIVPLAEVAPNYVHPMDGRTLAEIAAGFDQAADLRRREDVELGSKVEKVAGQKGRSGADAERPTAS